ncbi:hypothetical protein KIPB_005760 [Kipferlia bialata]|uniref:Uncharacterized protein n=1 Tax=Kipferlia bialata TaxID=797122 RepID=A0A9K3GIR2_9EUKA|nr:hypothetical protein KIPB_005760 [Kipferlia bialata]|eukprot:g5760.t1
MSDSFITLGALPALVAHFVKSDDPSEIATQLVSLFGSWNSSKVTERDEEKSVATQLVAFYLEMKTKTTDSEEEEVKAAFAKGVKDSCKLLITLAWTLYVSRGEPKEGEAVDADLIDEFFALINDSVSLSDASVLAQSFDFPDAPEGAAEFVDDFVAIATDLLPPKAEKWAKGSLKQTFVDNVLLTAVTTAVTMPVAPTALLVLMSKYVMMNPSQIVAARIVASVWRLFQASADATLGAVEAKTEGWSELCVRSTLLLETIRRIGNVAPAAVNETTGYASARRHVSSIIDAGVQYESAKGMFKRLFDAVEVARAAIVADATVEIEPEAVEAETETETKEVEAEAEAAPVVEGEAEPAAEAEAEAEAEKVEVAKKTKVEMTPAQKAEMHVLNQLKNRLPRENDVTLRPHMFLSSDCETIKKIIAGHGERAPARRAQGEKERNPKRRQRGQRRR